jgi:hypothetical protein
MNRRAMVKAIAVAALLSAATGCSSYLFPPNLQPQKPVTASVKGRIFLITMGGDLKPARLATVYVLSSDALPDQPSLSKKEAAVKEACATLEQNRPFANQLPASINTWVAGRYGTALSDLEEMIRLSAAPPKGNSLQADEEGLFSLGQLQPGPYTIVAFGQAGINKGYWVSQLQLNSGEQKEIKMASPATACDVLP